MSNNLTQEQIDLIQILVVSADMRYHFDETPLACAGAGNAVSEQRPFAEDIKDLDTVIYAAAQRLSAALVQDPVSEILDRWVERRARLGLRSLPGSVDKTAQLAPLDQWPFPQPTH